MARKPTAAKAPAASAALTAEDLSVCSGCGVLYNFNAVQARPFKVCPVCGKPLDTDAAAHAHSDSDAHRSQLHGDTHGRLSPTAQAAADEAAAATADA